MTPEEGNWNLLDASGFSIVTKSLEGMEEPKLVVPIPKRYGGDQEESEETTLEKGNEMEGFTIAKTKEDAQKQIKVLEEVKEEVTSKIAELEIDSKKEEAPIKPALLDDFNNEDITLIQKNDQLESDRQSAIIKKQVEEQKNKEKRQEQGAKEFNDWNEYILIEKNDTKLFQ